jgi:hypothetical protein
MVERSLDSASSAHAGSALKCYGYLTAEVASLVCGCSHPLLLDEVIDNSA